LGEGLVGEVAIRSAYLFDGYRRNPGIARPMGEGGWFATGDLGFVLDGELYAVGRKKDLLIVRGKNLYPEDIEDCAGSEPGVRAGRVCAWGEYVESLGTEAVMLMAETAIVEPQERRALTRRVRQRVQRELDVFVQRVHWVPPRWLVKSSSGKMARRTNVERWKRESEVVGAPSPSR
jgi:acyl-CoA synthetase (AMP-forming)/AMP-acid ligase II